MLPLMVCYADVVVFVPFRLPKRLVTAPFILIYFVIFLTAPFILTFYSLLVT